MQEKDGRKMKEKKAGNEERKAEVEKGHFGRRSGEKEQLGGFEK